MAAREDELRRARLQAQGFILSEPVPRHETGSRAQTHLSTPVSTALALRHEQAKLPGGEAARSDSNGRESPPRSNGEGSLFSQGREEEEEKNEETRRHIPGRATARPVAQAPASWLERPFVALAASAAQAALAAAAAAVRGDSSPGTESASASGTSRVTESKNEEESSRSTEPGPGPAMTLESVNEKVEEVLSHVVDLFTGAGRLRGSPGSSGHQAELASSSVAAGGSDARHSPVGLPSSDKEKGTRQREERRPTDSSEGEEEAGVQVMDEASMTAEEESAGVSTSAEDNSKTTRSHDKHSSNRSSGGRLPLEGSVSRTNSQDEGPEENTEIDDDGEELLQRAHNLTKSSDESPRRHRVNSVGDAESPPAKHTSASFDGDALVSDGASPGSREKGVDGQEQEIEGSDERFLNRHSGIRFPLNKNMETPTDTRVKAVGKTREGTVSQQNGRPRRLHGSRQIDLKTGASVSNEAESAASSNGAEAEGNAKETRFHGRKAHEGRAGEGPGGKEQVHTDWPVRHHTHHSAGEAAENIPPSKHEAGTQPFREAIIREPVPWQVPDRESIADDPQNGRGEINAQSVRENAPEGGNPRARNVTNTAGSPHGQLGVDATFARDATVPGEKPPDSPVFPPTEPELPQASQHNTDEDGGSRLLRRPEDMSDLPPTAGLVDFLTVPTDVRTAEWQQMEDPSSAEPRRPPGETSPKTASTSSPAHLLLNTKGPRRHGASAPTQSGFDRLYPQFVAAENIENLRGSETQGEEASMQTGQLELLTDAEADEPVAPSASSPVGISSQIVGKQVTPGANAYEANKEKAQLKGEHEPGAGSVEPESHVGAQIGSAAAAAATSFAEKLRQLDWEKLALDSPVNKALPLFSYLLGQGGSAQIPKFEHQRRSMVVANSPAALPPVFGQAAEPGGRLTSDPLGVGQRLTTEQPGETDQVKLMGYSVGPLRHPLGANQRTESPAKAKNVEPFVSSDRPDKFGFDQTPNASTLTTVFSPFVASQQSTAGVQGQTDSLATARVPLSVTSNLQPLGRIMGLRTDSSLGSMFSAPPTDPALPNVHSTTPPPFSASNAVGQRVDRGMTFNEAGAANTQLTLTAWPASFTGLNGRGILQAASSLLKGF
ncbi:conserved hypothetical protein [Neospora caninum Liverpool]|uniref:Uncharacterized protein n=1 Tax=Neospora caninum (strain Liverpool) TaxID=572307 RepID=F0VCH8_NEOCL|nr:conserved hypothetical protein [Neospora caninum Liverpool]CBZ51300.1 conserved hypothetical protein [Neospora caninum Liverpool]CEL68614.1 TPA: hypothetical protein BN1204_043660 [Neospora caninum Liverpool]|eukprot:XP_003881333.1 conserved hypothetical protein [Neospora caninum Liverpool]